MGQAGEQAGAPGVGERRGAGGTGPRGRAARETGGAGRRGDRGAGRKGAGYRPSIGGPDGALCCAGVALALAVDWCSRDLGAASAYDPGAYRALFYTSLVIGFVALLAMALLGGRVSAWLERGRCEAPVCTVGALGAAGLVLKAAAPGLGLSPWLPFVSAAAAAAVTPFLLVAWLDACSEDRSRNAVVIFPVAFSLVALAYFTLRALGGAAQTGLMALMLVLCAVLFAARRAQLGRRAGGLEDSGEWSLAEEGEGERAGGPDSDEARFPVFDAGTPESPAGSDGLAGAGFQAGSDDLEVAPGPASPGGRSWSFPLAPVALMAVYSFDFYFSLALSDGPSPFGSLGMLAAGLAALACVAASPAGRPSRALYKLAMPCMLLGLLLLAYLEVGHAGAVMFTSAGLYAFLIFMDIELCEMCHRFSIDAVWMFGLVEAFSKLASAVGRPAGEAMVAAWPMGSQGCGLVMAGLVVLTAALSMGLSGERGLATAFGMRPSPVGGGGMAGPEAVMTYNERVVWECMNATRLFGLTQREEEVLELLVQGMSIPDIASRACISRGTAKTHVNHIYRKLDVHSRDAAAALVRRVSRGG